MRRTIVIALCAASLPMVAGPAQAALLQGGQTIAGGATVIAGPSSELISPVSNLVDGDLGNGVAAEWLPAANGMFATINLGKVYRLSDINVLNSINGGDRATATFKVEVSTTGLFAGEEVLVQSTTLQPKASGFQDISLPAFNSVASNPQLVARFVRVTPLTTVGGDFGPGIAEALVKGVTDRGTGALAATSTSGYQIPAEAYTRTVDLTDTAPASYTVRKLTPTSPSVVQSNGKSYTVTGGTFFGNGNVTDNTDNAGNAEVVWDGSTTFNDLADGYITVDLGQEMIIEGFNLLDSTSTSNDRATRDYLIRVSNDPTFAEQNNTEVATGTFSAIGASDSVTLAAPMLGRYVRFIASDHYGFSSGLDDLTVIGRTFTSQTIATGSTQIGDSSTFGSLPLSQRITSQFNLLALDVTGTGGGWSSSTLQTVEVLPEPASIVALGLGAALTVRRRR